MFISNLLKDRSFKVGVGSIFSDSHPQEEGRKEMFYLTTHSTHFIYGYMALEPARDGYASG